MNVIDMAPTAHRTLTFEEARDMMRAALEAEDKTQWHLWRHEAEQALVGIMRDMGFAEGEHGISSSDIRCQIISMLRFGEMEC